MRLKNYYAGCDRFPLSIHKIMLCGFHNVMISVTKSKTFVRGNAFKGGLGGGCLGYMLLCLHDNATIHLRYLFPSLKTQWILPSHQSFS